MGNRLKCPSVLKSYSNKLVSLWEPDKRHIYRDENGISPDAGQAPAVL